MVLFEDAPITRAAFGPPYGTAGGPRPIEGEWCRLAAADGDFVVYLAGAWNRRGSAFAWGRVAWGIAADEEHLRDAVGIRETSASSVERILSPLAHEARVRLMQGMFDGPKSPEELSEATGLAGGNLHEHLSELTAATYVVKTKGAYDLTPLGCEMRATVSLLARDIVKEPCDG